MNRRNEETKYTRSFAAERKLFHLDYRENDRGTFLRITEESNGKRNCVIIPSSGLGDFQDALDDLLAEVDGETNSNS